MIITATHSTIVSGVAVVGWRDVKLPAGCYSVHKLTETTGVLLDRGQIKLALRYAGRDSKAVPNTVRRVVDGMCVALPAVEVTFTKIEQE